MITITIYTEPKHLTGHNIMSEMMATKAASDKEKVRFDLQLDELLLQRACSRYHKTQL